MWNWLGGISEWIRECRQRRTHMQDFQECRCSSTDSFDSCGTDIDCEYLEVRSLIKKSPKSIKSGETFNSKSRVKKTSEHPSLSGSPWSSPGSRDPREKTLQSYKVSGAEGEAAISGRESVEKLPKSSEYDEDEETWRSFLADEVKRWSGNYRRMSEDSEGSNGGGGVELAASPRRVGGGGSSKSGQGGQRDPPHMVVQSDFRKVSGISSEIFRQIETVENDHDASTAAAMDVVERRGEMVVRLLDPRTLSRNGYESAKRFLALQTSKFSVQLVEIVKRPGQTLGLYIREGNGAERQEGVFISRIALESPVYNSGCLRVGDEVLAVNLVDVTRMSLDDVVIIMSIPRRLLLTTRSRRGVRQPLHQPNRLEPKPPPVVVLKKDYEEDPLDDSNSNGDQLRLGAMGRPPPPHGMPPPHERFSTLPRYRPPDMSVLRYEEPLASYNRSGPPPQGPPPLPPHYPGMKFGHPGVPMGMGPPPHPGYPSRGGPGAVGRLPGPVGSRGGYGVPPGPDHLYHPPPPVITEQPRTRHHLNFYQYDRSYPKTLESLAERIHSFYGPPKPPGPQSLDPRLGYGGTLGRSTAGRPRLARTLSDQRLPATEREALSDYEGSSGVSAARRYKAWQEASLAPLQQAYGSGEGATLDRYQEAMRRLSALRQRTRSVDYASDTEVLAPRPLAARPRSASSRSNSLPRQRLHRGGGDPLMLRSGVGVGRSARSSLGPGLRLGSTGRHSLAGSEDESDGAVSAPEMPSGHRRDRGKKAKSIYSVDVEAGDMAEDFGELALPASRQDELEYHLQQKRFLKQKLKQNRQQILLEKHMQLLQEQQKQQEDKSSDLLSQQLDQHIFYQQRQLEQRAKEENSGIAILATGSFPDLSSDFLTQQLDQHIQQQQQQQLQQQQKQLQDKRTGTKDKPLRGSLKRSFRARPRDNSDSSDVNTSSATEDEASHDGLQSCAPEGHERGAAEGQEFKPSNLASSNSMTEPAQHSRELVSSGSLDAEPVIHSRDEEVPLVLQQHTLPQSLLKHRRAKSDAYVKWSEQTGAVSDLLPSELTQYNTELNAQSSFSLRTAQSIGGSQTKFDSYAQVMMTDTTRPAVLLGGNALQVSDPFSGHLGVGGMYSSFPPHSAAPVPQVVVHSPRDSPIDYRTSYPLHQGKGVRDIALKNTSITCQSESQGKTSPKASSSPATGEFSYDARGNTSSPHAFHPTSSSDGSSAYLYSLSSQTLPRNFHPRRVTFAASSDAEAESAEQSVEKSPTVENKTEKSSSVTTCSTSKPV